MIALYFIIFGIAISFSFYYLNFMKIISEYKSNKKYRIAIVYKYTKNY